MKELRKGNIAAFAVAAVLMLGVCIMPFSFASDGDELILDDIGTQYSAQGIEKIIALTGTNTDADTQWEITSEAVQGIELTTSEGVAGAITIADTVPNGSYTIAYSATNPATGQVVTGSFTLNVDSISITGINAHKSGWVSILTDGSIVLYGAVGTAAVFDVSAASDSGNDDLKLTLSKSGPGKNTFWIKDQRIMTYSYAEAGTYNFTLTETQESTGATASIDVTLILDPRYGMQNMIVGSLPVKGETSEGTEETPMIWWNKTIILTPEVVAGEIADPATQTTEAPESLIIDWGDGQSEVRNVDGFITKGSMEIEHTYSEIGKYHITCTPQKPRFTYQTYETFVDIKGAPTVYFYDGETEITSVVAENGSGVGEYAKCYFTAISAPRDPVKEGKVFEGWYYNGSEFDFSNVIVSPIVLQAQWSDVPVSPVQPDNPATEKIKVYVDGQELTLDKGTKVSDLKAEPLTGGKFDGWFADKDRTIALDSDTVLTSGMQIYAKYAPAPEPKDNGLDIPVVAIIVTAVGAVVAVIGLRYHPAILIAGIAVAVVGGLDIGGIIDLF